MTSELKELTVEELKEACKKLGLRGYSNLTEDELISKIIDSKKVSSFDEVVELLTKEEVKETKIKLYAKRNLSYNFGTVSGGFELSEGELKEDARILKAIELGFVVKV